jgi:hypothetical protein
MAMLRTVRILDRYALVGTLRVRSIVVPNLEPTFPCGSEKQDFKAVPSHKPPVPRNSSQMRCDGVHLQVALRWGMMVIGILPLWGGHVLGRRG